MNSGGIGLLITMRAHDPDHHRQACRLHDVVTV
jgi:hypothetical protein